VSDTDFIAYENHRLTIANAELRKERDELEQRIKRLEDIIEKASKHFRSAGPNAFTAYEMADVLKEAKP
jgi:hypothetical protein